MNTPPSLDDDLRYSLGVISGKLDLIMVQNAQAQQASDARFAKIEQRQDDTDAAVSGLQRDRSWLLGGAATIAAIGSAVSAWLGMR